MEPHGSGAGILRSRSKIKSSNSAKEDPNRGLSATGAFDTIPASYPGEDPLSNDAEIRRRSVLAWKHKANLKQVDDGEYPSNEQVIQALQAKVSKSVEVARRYRRVLWYSVFVAVYLIVLYLQASAYKSGEVVSTLRNALMIDGQLSMTFNNEDEVLAYLGEKVLLPTWKDPVCGDGQCEFPWEFPAYGRFGCLADCGSETNTTKIAVNIRANFVGHPTISPRVLMSSVRWNLCLNDPERTARGESDLCWYEEDRTFDEVKVNLIESADVVDGTWYVIIKGDYTGRVSGTVYDLTDPQNPEEIELEPEFEKCKLPTGGASAGTAAASTASRKLQSLLEKFDEGHRDSGSAGEVLRNLRREFFPHVQDGSPQDLLADLKERIAQRNLRQADNSTPLA